MYIIKVVNFIKYFFYTTILLLIITSFYPGSIFGFFFYGDLNIEPDLFKNTFFETSTNHFFAYFFITLLGLFISLKNEIYQKVFYGMFFLAIVLETIHSVLPYRSFENTDLIANILGVLVAYSIVKIYLLFNRS